MGESERGHITIRYSTAPKRNRRYIAMARNALQAAGVMSPTNEELAAIIAHAVNSAVMSYLGGPDGLAAVGKEMSTHAITYSQERGGEHGKG